MNIAAQSTNLLPVLSSVVMPVESPTVLSAQNSLKADVAQCHMRVKERQQEDAGAGRDHVEDEDVQRGEKCARRKKSPASREEIARECRVEEINQSFVFRVDLFCFGWRRFCQGAVAAPAVPEPRVIGGRLACILKT